MTVTTRAPTRRSRPIAGVLIGAAVAFLAGCGSPVTSASTKPAAARSPSVVATTTTTAAAIAYQIKHGDTLSSIAAHFGVTVAAILAANRLASPDRLSDGQTLEIPPPPPLALTVTPPDGQAGETFQLTVTGIKPSDAVTFEIDSPDGGKFTGPPHTPSSDGTVGASYQTSFGDVAGTYHVIARSAHGTTVEADFRIDPTTTTTL